MRVKSKKPLFAPDSRGGNPRKRFIAFQHHLDHYIFFVKGLRLRLHEELDFEDGLITSYGYEVYRGQEKLYWYDDFPHPNDPTLASTHPHHKHIPPNVKRNRIPAPGLSFVMPNLPLLIVEIEALLSLVE